MISRLAQARQLALSTGDCAPVMALVPYAQWLGIKMQLQEDSKPLFSLPFSAHLTGNPVLPAVHGGVTAAFLETAAMMHLATLLDEKRVPKCIDFSIDYLRSAACVESFADCEVTRLGRRVAHVQIRCWQDAPKRPVAIARAHFLLSNTE